jgi:DNA segregation ATPase FtsK/SpoIIIE-like protein
MEWLHNPNPYTGLGGSGADIPDFVAIDDVPAPGPSSVTLGIGIKGPVSIDLSEESPHVLVNAPTGLGKSTVARSIAVQRLAQGDVVIVLDRKMHSHSWARGLEPLAHYFDTVESIGHALRNLGGELSRRNRAVKAGETDFGPRIIVIFEETNATLTHLKQLDKLQGGGYGAMDAFSDLMFMGRSVRMHVVAFAQLASYRSGLTADLIENFGTRVMIGYSDKAWKWLASDCGRYRTAPSETGRGMVCHAGKARETQLAFVPEGEAADHVTRSVPAQRAARQLVASRRDLSAVWREAISR